MILYLHGFRSGPQSFKARATSAYLDARGLSEHFLCPALPFDPAAAIALAESQILDAKAAGRPVTLVGSSLGGYYATWLAERHDLNAALINPAVLAHVSLAEYIGPQTHFYTDETFDFTVAHIDTLRRLEVARPSPERYLLLVEKGDEVLDWRQAAERYAGCRQVILDGGDHSFTRFADYLPAIARFAGLPDRPAETATQPRI
jgi:predicted esterase YcpF (UPF0227 family)